MRNRISRKMNGIFLKKEWLKYMFSDHGEIANVGLVRRKIFFQFAVVVLLSCALIGSPEADATPISDQHKIDLTAFVSPDYKPGIIRHIVLFRYRESITDKERNEIQRSFLALKADAQRHGHPYIRSIETGEQISGEKAGHGMEQVFIVTFNSEGDRNYYVGTPVVNDPAYYDAAHADFKRRVARYLADILIFDYSVGTQDSR